jgi:hypothetical protein
MMPVTKQTLEQAARFAAVEAGNAAERVIQAHFQLVCASERDPYSAETIAKRDALHAAIAQAAALRRDADTLRIAAL